MVESTEWDDIITADGSSYSADQKSTEAILTEVGFPKVTVWERVLEYQTLQIQASAGGYFCIKEITPDGSWESPLFHIDFIKKLVEASRS